MEPDCARPRTIAGDDGADELLVDSARLDTARGAGPVPGAVPREAGTGEKERSGVFALLPAAAAAPPPLLTASEIFDSLDGLLSEPPPVDAAAAVGSSTTVRSISLACRRSV